MRRQSIPLFIWTALEGVNRFELRLWIIGHCKTYIDQPAEHGWCSDDRASGGIKDIEGEGEGRGDVHLAD